MPTCHYEILNLELDADDAQIKKSYRKQALKYHPDKNQDNLQEATEKFRLVQAAYDCLSDPQERAWYDDHRDAILKGYNIGEVDPDDAEDDCDGIYSYMTSFAYSGFDEKAKNNFYKVYNDVFIKIDTDEPHFEEAMPVFGKADSVWEDVNLFYSYWENYCTRKTYGYLDKYDTRQAPDRRVRRLMEQENKKVRDKAKKKRNETIRALVRFCRRRDPRVEERKEFLEKEAEIKKERQEAKRRARLEEQMEKAIEYEERMRNDSETLRELEQLAELEAQLEDEEEAEFEEPVRRGKKGKKKKRWSSDEDEPVAPKVDAAEDPEKDAAEASASTQQSTKNKKKNRKKQAQLKQQQAKEKEPSLEEASESPVKKAPPEFNSFENSEFTQNSSKKKKKKNKNKQVAQEIEEEDDGEDLLDVEDVPEGVDMSILKLSSDEGDNAFEQKSAKKKKKKGKKK